MFIQEQLQKVQFFLGFTAALCSESDGESTSNVLMLMLYWGKDLPKILMFCDWLSKRSLFVTRSLKRRFLLYSFIVFHCYN
jgi:hypothetical protein